MTSVLCSVDTSGLCHLNSCYKPDMLLLATLRSETKWGLSNRNQTGHLLDEWCLLSGCTGQRQRTWALNAKLIYRSSLLPLKASLKILTFNPLRIWYMRNCTWSSVSFWHLTMLLRSAPIRWVTRYLPIRKHCHGLNRQKMRRNFNVSGFIRWQEDINKCNCSSKTCSQSCL